MAFEFSKLGISLGFGAWILEFFLRPARLEHALIEAGRGIWNFDRPDLIPVKLD